MENKSYTADELLAAYKHGLRTGLRWAADGLKEKAADFSDEAEFYVKRITQGQTAEGVAQIIKLSKGAKAGK